MNVEDVTVADGQHTCGLRGSKPLKSSFGIKEVMTWWKEFRKEYL